MDLVERVKKFCRSKIIPLTLATTMLATTAAAQYNKINAVVAGSHDNGSAAIVLTHPSLEFYQLAKINNCTDENINYTAFKDGWTSFPLADQTAGWDTDNDWAGKDLFTYPTQVTFDATDNDITAKMVLDNITTLSSTENDLLLIYMIGHGEGSSTPGDGDINVATQAGATSWQGIPLDNASNIGDVNYAHFNKALELADYRLAILILDCCNSEAIIKDLDYTTNLQSNPLQKNVIAISSASVDESYTGTFFGHYFVHLTRDGKTIKTAVDSSGALKSLNPKIYYFGPNADSLESFANNHCIYDYLTDAMLGIDTIPPVISNTQPSGYTANNLQPITASIIDNIDEIDQSTINLNINGTNYNLSDPQLSFNGSTLTFTPSTPLSDGTKNNSLSVSDQDGNNASKDWSFIVDATAPVVNITSPTNDTSTLEQDITVRYNVTEQNPNYTQVKLNDNNWTTITADTVDFTSLARGQQHVVKVRHYDQAGTPGLDSVVINVLEEQNTVSPVISNTQPQSVGYLADNNLNISADITDDSGIDISSIVLNVNGTDYNLSSSQLSFDGKTLTYIPSSPFNDGKQNIILNVKDTDANSTSKPWSFNIDATAPVVNITSPQDNEQLAGDFPLIYSLTEQNLNYVEAKIDGNPWNNVEPDSFVISALEPGENHKIFLRAVDLAGNTGMDSLTIQVPSDIKNNPDLIRNLMMYSRNPKQLTYNLPKPSDVQLDVYTLKGQLLERLVNKTQEKGTYSIPINNLPSGYNVYKLKADGKTIAAKVLYIK
ncbi:hypothetical protein KY345_01560 [Candidatus Woesearchaeota archaeon]|nr:hypothetical protein [Candidatus Woesearchaeota archaeon]